MGVEGMMILGRFFQQEEGWVKPRHLIVAAVFAIAAYIILFHDGSGAGKAYFPKG
jgi:hypothetical protein